MLKDGHYIYTGEINSGKSTFLWNQYKNWAHQGIKVSGWITPPHFENDVKAGHDIVFLADSSVIARHDFIRKVPFDESFCWRGLHFNKRAFGLASKLGLGNPDIFVIDEIGPMELEDKQGFFESLPQIYAGCARTVTVVRRSSLNGFKAAFGPAFSLLEAI